VHDIVDLERRGIPGVFVATTEFVPAAIAQSTSLGFPTVARVFTPHPVQDRTDDEVRAYADLVYHEIVAAVTSAAVTSAAVTSAAVTSAADAESAPS
jgi:hypothetical protein